MRTEAVITRDLTRALRNKMPEAVIFKINDRITVGIPDISISWKHVTLWVEVKVAERGVIRDHRYWQRQLLQAQELEQQGVCLFVIYEEQGVSIALPSRISTTRRYLALQSLSKHDHQEVARLLAHYILERQ